MSTVALSNMTPDISFIWEFYKESSRSLAARRDRIIHSVDQGLPLVPEDLIFQYKTPQEIGKQFEKYQDELSAMTILDLLSAAEGRLRNDFEERSQDNNDTRLVSTTFRTISKYCISNPKKKPLNMWDLLSVWRDHEPSTDSNVKRFYNFFWPYRNWLAHGRWLHPPLSGAPLPPPAEDVKDIVERILNDFNIPID